MNLARIIYGVNLFFFFYMFLYAFLFFLMTIFSAFHLDDFFKQKSYMKKRMIHNQANYIPISILIPTYNEEVTIIDTLESLLYLDYPAYEIIMVNDGSIDRTVEKVVNHFNLKPVPKPYRRLIETKQTGQVYEGEGPVKILLLDKENGGKSDALNAGINLCSYPTFLCLDGDSMLQKDALQKIVEPFLEDDRTIAVGGHIKISNHLIIDQGEVVAVETPKKALLLFQKIEYLRVFLNSRISLNNINGNLIISGAFGLYNKQAVVNVGGYTNGLMGEDMEIMMKLHSFYRKNKLPYRTAYVPDAICWTQVPETLKVLKSQRRRWHVGLYQSLKRHKYMFLNPSYGSIGLISYPYFLFFEYITPFLEILGIITIALSFWMGMINTKFFLFYLFVYMGFNIIISLISIVIERYMFRSVIPTKLSVQLFLFSLIESFGYRQMISLFRIGHVFQRKHEWGEMTRVKKKSVESRKENETQSKSF